MSWLKYVDGSLQVENVGVSEIVDQFSTPLYIYSKSEILKNFNCYKNALKVSIPKIYGVLNISRLY